MRNENNVSILAIIMVVCIFALAIFMPRTKDERTPEEKLVSKIVFEFEDLEYTHPDGFGKPSPRDYESIVNKMMEEFEDNFKFYSLELISSEIDGIKSGVVAEYAEGKFLVITNELMPGAVYSGPAALFFTESRPQTIKQ